jgi:hypothetical protein
MMKRILLKTAWHLGSDRVVVNDPLGEPGCALLYVGLLSTLGSVDGDCLFSPCFMGELLKDDPGCVCRMGPQTTDHLIWECAHLLKQRETLKNRIRKAGRNWPLSNSDLANNYTKWFQMFVNSINFDTLWHAQNRPTLKAGIGMHWDEICVSEQSVVYI